MAASRDSALVTSLTGPTFHRGGELDRLVERAQFFDLPAEVRALNPGADRFQYRLTMKGRKQPQGGMCARLLNWLTAKTHKR